MNLLQELLQTVEIGTPQTFGGMTLFPLLRPIVAEPDYWTLTEAMNQNLLKITEVSEGGMCLNSCAITGAIARYCLWMGKNSSVPSKTVFLTSQYLYLPTLI